MPPSGYGEIALGGLRTYHRANTNDLQEEVRAGKYPDIDTALTQELSRINKALARGIPDKITRGLLEITSGYYECLARERQLSRGDLPSSITIALKEFEQTARSIHLTEEGELEKRAV